MSPINATTGKPFFTFAVDNVEPASELLPEIKIHDSLRRWMESFESCSDYHSSIVDTDMHPFLGAVYLAFSQHRPLILSPDSVWLTISRGVANHMAIYAERLRDRFVAHKGKLMLQFEARHFVKGTPENPWQEAFDAWTGQIREHVGSEIYDTLVCDFGTSSPTDVAASHVVMMDVFKKYFRYVVCGVCGIPEVTLIGEVEDWEKLEYKVESLRDFDFDWWIDELKPICRQFTEARRGNVDHEHWRSVCKLREAYGGDIINGWVAKMFPYVEQHYGAGDLVKRNPVFDSGDGISTRSVGSGLSIVPFEFRNQGRAMPMEALGGLIGVRQCSATKALEPISGWAVRDASKYDRAIYLLSAQHEFIAKPTQVVELEENDGVARQSSMNEIPKDVVRFFEDFDSAKFTFHNGRQLILKSFNVDDVLYWKGQEGLDPEEHYLNTDWIRLGQLGDGRELALHTRFYGWDAKEILGIENEESRRMFSILGPICLSTVESRRTGEGNPVIAVSFSDLLQRLAESGVEEPYWEQEGFAPICEAKEMVDCFEES